LQNYIVILACVLIKHTMPKERSKSDSNFITGDHIIDDEHFQDEKSLYHASEARRDMGRTRSLGNDLNLLRTTRPSNISEDTMKEVSSAIKQYMDESECKQSTMVLQIESLSKRLSAANLQVQQIEKEMTGERSQFVKDKQQMLVSHQENQKNLERSLLEKDDQLRHAKKICENLRSQLDSAMSEKVMERDEMQGMVHRQEAGYVEERIRLEEVVKEQDMRIEVLTLQLQKSQEKENQSRTTETRLVMEVQLKSQELQHKNDAIIDLKSKVKELKEEMKSAQDTVTYNFRENNQLAEVGTVLKFELTKLRDHLDERERENQKLKDELTNVQREMARLHDSEATLSRAAENGQQMVISLKQSLEDAKDLNQELVSTVKDFTFREKQMERTIDELQLTRVTTPLHYQYPPPPPPPQHPPPSQSQPLSPPVVGCTESFIEHKIQEASSKTESKVKKEVASINDKLRQSTQEVENQYKHENNTLREMVRTLELESQKAVFDCQTSERNIRDELHDQIQELSTSFENEKRNVQMLSSKLEQSYSIIEELENQSRHLSRKSSQADAHVLNLEVSNTELKAQLDHQTKSMESLENDSKTCVDKERQRKTTIQQLRKKVKDLREANDSLTEEVSRVNEQKASCTNELEKVSVRKVQLEVQSKRLGANLIEMNQFMQRTRQEVEQLRVENERQVDANQALTAKIETFKASHLLVMEKQREDKQCVVQYQLQLQDMASNMERLTEENNSLKQQIKERALSLDKMFQENEKIKQKAQQQETNITKQQRSFQAKSHECESLSRQCSELVVKMEELQEQSLTTKQTCSNSQLEQDALKKELRSLRHQLEDLARERDAVIGQCEEVSRDKQRLDERISSMSRHLESVESENSVLHKEKMEITDYAKKLEMDIGKGLKALQQQEAEINQLSSMKNELQDCARELKERLCTTENQNTRLSQEMEEISQSQEQSKVKTKKMERQLHTDVETIDKLKLQVSSLRIKLDELQAKQASHSSTVETHKNAHKDLLKQYEKMRTDHERALKMNGSMKAQAIEMQAIIDGTTKKHNWIVQNEQEHRDEMKRLREQNQAMTDQLLTVKEELMKTKMTSDRMSGDLERRMAEVEAAKEQLDARRASFQTKNDIASSELDKLKNDLAMYKQRERDLEYSYDDMKTRHEESVECLRKSKEKCEKLEGELKGLYTEITDLKLDLQQKTHEGIELSEKNTKVQQNFVQLVDVLKKMKKERDSLSAILRQIEDDNRQITVKCNKLEKDVSNTSRDLEDRKASENKTLEDNEQLKSRISILKYTETLRSSENKELVERLSQLEIKLQDAAKQQRELDDLRLKDVTVGATGTAPSVPEAAAAEDSIKEDMVLNLCKRLKESSGSRSSHIPGGHAVPLSTTDRYKEEMKSFMDEIFSKRQQQSNSSTRDHQDASTSTPVFSAVAGGFRRPNLFRESRFINHNNHSGATKKRQVLVCGERNNNENWRDTQMDHLYDETKRIQASLLADIKKLSKSFAEQRRF